MELHQEFIVLLIRSEAILCMSHSFGNHGNKNKSEITLFWVSKVLCFLFFFFFRKKKSFKSCYCHSKIICMLIWFCNYIQASHCWEKNEYILWDMELYIWSIPSNNFVHLCITAPLYIMILLYPSSNLIQLWSALTLSCSHRKKYNPQEVEFQIFSWLCNFHLWLSNNRNYF